MPYTGLDIGQNACLGKLSIADIARRYNTPI